MAAIISFLSSYNKTSTLEEYKLPDGKSILKGTFTNEVPINYLISRAVAEKEKDEKIKLIFIVSKVVFEHKNPIEIVENVKDDKGNIISRKIIHSYNGKDNQGISQYEYYCQWFAELMNANDYKGIRWEIVAVPYDYRKDDVSNNPLGDLEIANNLYLNISQATKTEKKIYIDYTGGFRDMNYLVATLIQYFKIAGEKCQNIVYSAQSGTLKEINYIYKINEIIRGADDFVSTGNITQLKSFFEPTAEETKTADPRVLKIINSIDKFTKALSISQLDKIDDYKRDVEESISEYDKNRISSDLYTNIFTLLFDKIKESLHIGSGKKWGYIEIVEWCVDHGYLQQAFTIYVEKVPQIYLDAGIKEKLPESRAQKTDMQLRGKSTESTLFYTEFWDSFCGIRKIFEEFAEKIEVTFKSSDDKRSVYNRFICYNIEKSDVFSDEEKECLVNLRKEIKEHNFGEAFDDFGVYISQKKLEETEDKEGLLYTTVFYDCKKLAYQLLKKYSGTEKMKLAAVNRLDAKYSALSSIMRIYLAVKIMRNHMSHAIGEGKPQEKAAIIKVFEQEGFLEQASVKDVFGYDYALALIKKGIEITKNIEKTPLFP